MNWEALVIFSYGGSFTSTSTFKKTPYYVNPTRDELHSLSELATKKHPDYPHLRGILDHSTGKAYVFPYEFAEHADLEHHLPELYRSSTDKSNDVQNIYIKNFNKDKDKHPKFYNDWNKDYTPDKELSHPWVKSL